MSKQPVFDSCHVNVLSKTQNLCFLPVCHRIREIVPSQMIHLSNIMRIHLVCFLLRVRWDFFHELDMGHGFEITIAGFILGLLVFF